MCMGVFDSRRMRWMPEVGEDLAAQADGAQDAPGAVLRAFAVTQLLVQDEPAGVRSLGPPRE